MKKFSRVATRLGLILLAGLMMFLAPAFAGNDAKAKEKYFEAENQLNSGDATGAISSLEEAIDLLGSTNPRIQVLLVKACKLAGLQDRALAELKTFFRIVPSDAQGSVDYDEMSKLQTELTTIKENAKENPSEPKSNEGSFSISPGEVFNACGYEWKAGPDCDTSFDEAQAWINRLGDGWGTPSKSQLKELYNSNIKPPYPGFVYVYVWSTEKDASYGWNFYFLNGKEDCYVRSYRCNRRALAVRSR